MPDVRMPDGTIIRNVPEGASRDQIMAAYQKARQSGEVADARPKSFLRGMADEIGRGASNAMWVMDTLGGRNVAKALTGQPTPSDIARAQNNRTARQAPTRGSTAGRITGGILATLPTMLIPGGAFAQGVAGGALLTKDPNDLRGLAYDAALGGVMGKVGQQAGKRVAAPLAERVGRTAPARAIGRTVAKAADRILPNGAQQLPLPKFTPADRAVTRMAPDLADARQIAADAQRLNLPMALADTDPRLRQLAGSAARFSPQVRAQAERDLALRSRGQADRAINAIDERLAPITNIGQRSTEIIESGKPVYGPLYEQAYAAPPITSPRLQQVLQTPAGREAVGRANTIAANEFRDPKAMGFMVDDAGNVVLEPSVPMTLASVGRPGGDPVQRPGYTTQSLDYVKRGIDDILEPQRNQITGKLQLDEGGRAINGVKQSLVQEVDSLNPEYKAARDAYALYAQQAEALRTGHGVLPQPSIPQRDFDAILGRATDRTRPELQRGYATAMADEVAKRRMSGNPYDAVYGSPLQQQKVAALFPEGSQDFGRVAELETLMQQTRNEVLGGSQTQPRKVADDAFQNDLANSAVDAGVNFLSGGGISGASSLMKSGVNAVRDRSRLGLMGAQRRAEEIGPTLLDTSNPGAITDYLDDLGRRIMEQEMRAQAYRRAGGLFGASTGAGVGLSLLPR